MIYQEVNILLTKMKGLKASMLRSHLCDYSDVYIVVEGRKTVTVNNAARGRNKN